MQLKTVIISLALISIASAMPYGGGQSSNEYDPFAPISEGAQSQDSSQQQSDNGPTSAMANSMPQQYQPSSSSSERYQQYVQGPHGQLSNPYLRQYNKRRAPDQSFDSNGQGQQEVSQAGRYSAAGSNQATQGSFAADNGAAQTNDQAYNAYNSAYDQGRTGQDQSSSGQSSRSSSQQGSTQGSSLSQQGYVHHTPVTEQIFPTGQSIGGNWQQSVPETSKQQLGKDTQSELNKWKASWTSVVNQPADGPVASP
jgi:hypothetical protein